MKAEILTKYIPNRPFPTLKDYLRDAGVLEIAGYSVGLKSTGYRILPAFDGPPRLPAGPAATDRLADFGPVTTPAEIQSTFKKATAALATALWRWHNATFPRTPFVRDTRRVGT